MKAFLLAAGKGTRLRPLTDTVPKCLVDIQGRPLLSIWFELLGRAGITDVLINTHHLPEVVERYVHEHTPPDLRVTLFHEKELLGSAGTVKHNRDFIGADPETLIIYADNLSSIDLRAFLQFHQRKQSLFTMGLFRAAAPEECGIATLDADKRVVAFTEKPKNPVSDLANAGIYAMSRELLDLIPDQPLADFGYDIIPQLVGKMYGYLIPGYYMDIGTWERLERARREWPGRI
ncbi:MAG TPA: nucleotidyltransferase family protein [Kiritimatiellia bacterium]|nr:nucleotidyltransferase family protein [Kiritimatiellia bacterium]